MSSIQKLPQEVILKIAAGEVVERPASVLKELIENAIDSGAQNIDINVQRGGLDLIEIRDDGSGIRSSELQLALSPHATSKLRSPEDLFSIETRGFRGEALASIASISKLRLSSKFPDEETAFEIESDGTQLKSIAPCALSQGSKVEVRSLFFNTPGRRKFMKSAQTEKQHLLKVFTQAALSSPNISFTFSVEGECLHDLKSGDIKNRILELFGKDKQHQLLPVFKSVTGLKLSGFVSDRSLSFSRASEIWTFVNHRPVSDKTINAAIMEGYRTALMERKYPMAVLFIQADPQLLDVNIHPRKEQVRFAQGNHLFSAIQSGICQALSSQQKSDTHRSSEFSDLPSSYTLAKAGSSQATNPNQRFSSASPVHKTSSSSQPKFPSQYHLMNTPSHQAGEAKVPYFSETDETQVDGGSNFFQSLQYLGHVDHTYLLFKGPDSLYIMDQHAAHERVLYTQFKKQQQDTRLSQNLLSPVCVELDANLFACVEEHLEHFEALGFGIEVFGQQSVLIRSFPFHFPHQDLKSSFIELCRDLQSQNHFKHWNDVLDHVYATMACHAAVRAHDPLSPPEIQQLLKQMDCGELSSYCPHGRPSFLRLGTTELEKMFRRA